MAISFTGAGSWGVRVGHQGGLLNELNDARGTAYVTGVDSIYDDFSTYPDSQVVGGLIPAYNNAVAADSAFATFLAGLCQSTTIQMVKDDVAINSVLLRPALVELIAQMVTQTASVIRPTVSTTTSAGSSNVGTGVMKSSVINPSGVQQDYLYAETIRAVVDTDSWAGTATAYREKATVTGELAVADLLSPLWPLGSGASTQINCTDATQDASATGNMLTNSDFLTAAVANTPNNWTINVGTPGTTVFVDGTGLRSANSLRFLGTGAAELSSVVQPFNNASGTTTTPKPNTVYSVGFWVKVSSAPGAGVLQVSLVDGTGASPSILTNDASTSQATTVTLSGETSTYAFKQFFIQTPKTLTTTLAFRVRLSTAITSTFSVVVSDLSMTPAILAYPGGPYLGWHNGATRATVGDLYNSVVANDYSSAWQLLAQRVFNMTSLGLQLRSVAAGETIADSLITTT